MNSDPQPPAPGPLAHRPNWSPVEYQPPPYGARPFTGVPVRPIEREFSLADLGRVLQHLRLVVARHWLFGSVLAIGALVATGYFYVNARPEHVAETTVVANSPLDQALREPEKSTGTWNPDREENIMRNHQAAMTSRMFRQKLVESFTPEEALAIQQPYLEPGEAPSETGLRSVLARSLSVEREARRDLFKIQVKHRSEEVALLVADRFTDTYLDYTRQDLRSADISASEALRAQAAEVERSIQELETQRRDFQTKFAEITGGGGLEVIEDRIRTLNAALSDRRVERAQAEVMVRQARDDIARTPTPFSNPTLAAFGNIQQLRADLDRRISERAVLATNYGPNHPRMREAERAITNVQETLEHAFQLALADVEGRLEMAQAAENRLQDELNMLFEQAYEIDHLRAELNTLDNEIAARRASYSGLLHRIDQADIASELPVDVMRVVDRAYVRRPVVEQRTVILLAGIVAALALFVGGPLLLHALNPRASSSVDLESVLGTELLGVVPRLGWMLQGQRPHVVRRGRRPLAVEAFLSTASQFELRFEGCPRRIMISSTLPGEGKSVIACNLAAAFTRLGYRTLLVDCDFRRPMQHRFNECPNDIGLLAWIERGCPGGGAATPEELGLCALPDGTYLLPTGGIDAEPARDFLLPPVLALFERLATDFDVTIIDTPPAGLFPDAFFVARLADASVLVVRENVAPTAQVRKVIADFTRTRAPVAGIIFNDIVDGSTHPAFRYRTISSKYSSHYGVKRARRRPSSAPVPAPTPAPTRAPAPADPVTPGVG